MTTVRQEPESADTGIEDLLREVGSRDEPSADAMNEVRAAVQAEWHSMVTQRRQQRRAVAWRIAASLVIAVLVATFAQRYLAPAPVQVATIANIDGHLLAAAGEAKTKDQPVLVGDTVRTDDESRAALSFPSGLSLRLDHGTALTVAATDSIELTTGAVYIDSPSANPTGTALTIETHAGSVRHLGTQYEVRTHTDGIVVRVREGRVMITGTNGSSTGDAGQILQLSKRGDLTRGAITPTDSHWSWTTDAAPDFDIENQSLAAFLQWIARETGRRLVYSSSTAEQAAMNAKLHGSIVGLDADAALAAVLSTTQLRRYQTNPEELGIELIAAIDSNTPARPTL